MRTAPHAKRKTRVPPVVSKLIRTLDVRRFVHNTHSDDKMYITRCNRIYTGLWTGRGAALSIYYLNDHHQEYVAHQPTHAQAPQKLVFVLMPANDAFDNDGGVLTIQSVALAGNTVLL